MQTTPTGASPDTTGVEAPGASPSLTDEGAPGAPADPGSARTRRAGWRRWLRWRVLAAAAASALLLLIGSVVLAYLAIDVPAVKADVGKQATVFLFADGRTELGRVGTF